jgi:hypothetical protein
LFLTTRAKRGIFSFTPPPEGVDPTWQSEYPIKSAI